MVFKDKGQTLVELLLAFGLMSIILPALLTGFATSRAGKPQLEQRIQAIALLKETEEAVRAIRESGWNNFAQNGTFHPILSGSTYALSSGSATLGDFTQTVVISDVFRTNGVIVTTGGSVDPSTKKVLITIDWGLPLSTSLTSTIYLTRHLDNATYVETTQAQFNAGTKTGVTVQSTTGSGIPDDGEIILGAGGFSDWCGPTFEQQLNLPKSGKATSVTAIPGEAYAGTGENSSGESLADILLGSTHPQVATIYGTVDGFKTYDIFGEADYAYLATDTNSKEVVIYSLSNPPAPASFTEIGLFNVPGSDQAESLYVLGNTGYIVVKNKLWNFNLDAKTGARPVRDSDGITLSGEGTAVYVVGNYAYVSIKGNNNAQVQIIDVGTSPTNMTSVGLADVNNQSGQDVFVRSDGNRAYVVTNSTSSTEREFHVINTTNKSNPVKIGSGFWTNGMSPEAVEVVPGNRAIIVGQGGTEYQVVNLDNEASPVACGTGVNVDSGIFDSASVIEPDGDAYTYIVTGDASSEFKIIVGGPGGSYATTGIFESATFNPGYMTANNRFTPTYSLPSGTTLQFQVSMAIQTGGICPATGSYTFVGPGGSTSTYFTPSSGQPVTYPFTSTGAYTNPGQCFRYKAYFSTTNGSSTPVLSDVTINYSP